MQQISKFNECPYGSCIKIAFRESVLSCISDPGLRDREDIILGLKGILALTVNFPDLQNRKTAAIKRMVGMEDSCCSQIPAVIKCFLL